MQGLKIIIVGSPEFLSEPVRKAWRAAGIELLGPYPIAMIDRTEALKSNGVVIDICEDPEAIFALSEKLESWQVPFLYALPTATALARTGPYMINDRSSDMEAVVGALMKDYDKGVRH